MRRNYRKKKFNKKKKNTYKIFFLVLVGMTVGFAAINTTLQLIGTLNIARTTWNIHWENPTKTGGVTATQDVHLKSGDSTTVEYQVNLSNPGDYYEFTVDAKNDGTIDAMITDFSNKVYENNVEVTPTYLESTITYSDGTAIDYNHLLSSGNKETYKVKVQYKTNLSVDQLPDTTKTYSYRFTVTYMQADEEHATPARVDFATSSWGDLIAAYRTGHTTELQQAMNAGTTREVELDLDNNGTAETTAHLRIANLSTPAACSTEGFSQSACGFVIEFADVIRTDLFSISSYEGQGNKGGWSESTLSGYLDNYLYNGLPSELKSRIIDTTVVSGGGEYDETYLTTTDKIYLLATHEVYEYDGNAPNNISTVDLGYNKTRQLDYYYNKGVTTTNYSNSIKKNLSGNNTTWWTRSADSGSTYEVYTVSTNGCGEDDVETNNGVSPAFRIAK